jgi:hypothetical protein
MEGEHMDDKELLVPSILVPVAHIAFHSNIRTIMMYSKQPVDCTQLTYLIRFLDPDSVVP